MLVIAPRIVRRTRSIATATAFFVALGAFVWILSEARGDWYRATRPLESSQRLGSQATATWNAIREPWSAALLVGYESRRDGFATFTLDRIPTLDRATSASIVMDADGFEKPRRGATAYVSLEAPAFRSVFRVPLGGATYVTLAPYPTAGYRFRLVAPRACAFSRCRLSIRTHGVSWRIRRIALISEESLGRAGVFR